MERELWVLMQAVSPKEAAIWIADKNDAMGDPEFCAIYLEHDSAFDWPVDDLRLVALADRSARWFADHPVRPERRESEVQESPAIQLIAASFDGASPAWNRLAELARQWKTRG